MGVGKNLKALRELRGLTQMELSEKTKGKVSQAAISALEIRDSNKTRYLKELAMALGVKPFVLLRQDLSPLDPSIQNVIAWEDGGPSEEEFVDIPEYELCVSAGNGFENSNNDAHFRVLKDAPSVRYRVDFFTSRGINSDQCKRFKVIGDSMEPLLFDGDRILVNTALIDNLKDGAVYAVNYDGELRVKRIYKTLDGTIRLISDNPSYLPEDVPTSAMSEGRFFIIGKVIEKSSTHGFG